MNSLCNITLLIGSMQSHGRLTEPTSVDIVKVGYMCHSFLFYHAAMLVPFEISVDLRRRNE